MTFQQKIDEITRSRPMVFWSAMIARCLELLEASDFAVTSGSLAI